MTADGFVGTLLDFISGCQLQPDQCGNVFLIVPGKPRNPADCEVHGREDVKPDHVQAGICGQDILDVVFVHQCKRRLRLHLPQQEIDKLIAATTLLHGLTPLSRNVSGFRQTGVLLRAPFVQEKLSAGLLL